MYVRLGFAVASCIEPELLLVDEVLAVGDAAFQQKCLQRIRLLMEQGTSLIFVSHNLYLVQSACKQAVYLQRGQVRMVGDVRDVFDEYENDLHKERAQRFEKGDKGARTEGDLVEITKVEVVNEDGLALDIFPSQCPAQVRIHYNAYANLGPVNLSVFIHRSDGANCCMVRSKHSGFEVDLQQGSGVVTVTLSPLQLVGGSYFAEAWFLNQDDSMTITSQAARSDWFIVQGIALSYHEDSIFEPNASWQVHQEAPLV
jgi:ABC-type glutathione transport system ATPase component